MATVNKASLRAQFDALNARFEALCAAGKMSAESRALVDATARTRPGAKGKGPSTNAERCAHTRTRVHTRRLTVDACARCGEDLTDTAATGHERRALVDIVFEKVVRHADADIKHCPRCHSIQRLGDIEDVLLGVEDIDALDGVRHMLVGEVPDPGRAIAEDDPALDAEQVTALALAPHPTGKGGKLLVRIAGRDRFDGRVIGDGAGVAKRLSRGVAAACGPEDGELHFPGAGRAIGLLAGAPCGLGPAHRHRRAVETQMRVAALAGSASTTSRSSRATSRPRASAWRSTCLGWTARPASSRSSELELSKLSCAAHRPTMRITPGDRDWSCRPSAWSRGLKPLAHAAQ